MKPTKLTNDLQIFTASMGKIFKVSAVCSNDDEANEFCRKHSDTGVIAVDNNGYIYIAEIYGKTIKSAELKQFVND